MGGELPKSGENVGSPEVHVFRLALRYFLMVTPPLLGVLALLQLGQGLTPPVSVKGAWTLEINPPAPSSSCAALSFDQIPATLLIAQSGPQLQLSLNDAKKTMLTGQISESTITADENAQGAQASPVSFEARADPHPIPDRLVGQFSLTNCSTPATVAFTALREKGTGGQP